MQTGLGQVAIPHSEIRAWALNTETPLAWFEAEWLNTMSAAYAAEMQRSHGEGVSGPFEAG